MICQSGLSFAVTGFYGFPMKTNHCKAADGLHVTPLTRLLLNRNPIFNSDPLASDVYSRPHEQKQQCIQTQLKIT